MNKHQEGTVQAKKIEFSDYVVPLDSTRINQITGEFEAVTINRTMDGSLWLKQHLYANAAQHSAEELMGAAEIVGKIYAAKEAGETSVLLETAEWDMVKRVINKLKGYGEVDIIMLQRVLQAPTVEMEEKEE